MLDVYGATAEGKKEVLGIADGYRESEESWKELLLDLKQRGLTIDPNWPLAMGLSDLHSVSTQRACLLYSCRSKQILHRVCDVTSCTLDQYRTDRSRRSFASGYASWSRGIASWKNSQYLPRGPSFIRWPARRFCVLVPS